MPHCWAMTGAGAKASRSKARAQRGLGGDQPWQTTRKLAPALFRLTMGALTQPLPKGADMSLDRAKNLAHNMRAKATELGDTELAEMAQLFHEVADGLDREMRDIKHLLQDIQHQVRNLR